MGSQVISRPLVPVVRVSQRMDFFGHIELIITRLIAIESRQVFFLNVFFNFIKSNLKVPEGLASDSDAKMFASGRHSALVICVYEGSIRGT